MNPHFVDALKLAQLDLTGIRSIVLCGESGSGKSSAIRFLLHAHSELQGDPNLRVIEELRSWRDLGKFLKPMLRRQRLLVASHLPIWLHRALGLFSRTHVIALDRHPEKISAWLTARGAGFSEPAVRAFCARFGANYTDAALILDHDPSSVHAGIPAFDLALARFLRRCTLVRGGIADGMPVLLMTAHEAEQHYQSQNHIKTPPAAVTN